MLDSLLAGLCRMPKNFRAVLVRALMFASLCASLTICASTAAAQTDTFAGTGDMVTPRGQQTATLLNNGKVLMREDLSLTLLRSDSSSTKL